MDTMAISHYVQCWIIKLKINIFSGTVAVIMTMMMMTLMKARFEFLLYLTRAKDIDFNTTYDDGFAELVGPSYI